MPKQPAAQDPLELIAKAKTRADVVKCLDALRVTRLISGEQLTALHPKLIAALLDESEEGLAELIVRYQLVRDRRGVQVTFAEFFEAFDPTVFALAVDTVDPMLLRIMTFEFEQRHGANPPHSAVVVLAAAKSKLGEHTAAAKYCERALSLGFTPSELDEFVPGWSSVHPDS